MTRRPAPDQIGLDPPPAETEVQRIARESLEGFRKIGADGERALANIEAMRKMNPAALQVEAWKAITDATIPAATKRFMADLARIDLDKPRTSEELAWERQALANIGKPPIPDPGSSTQH